MKKLNRLAFLYALLAIAAGVFYREFTKFCAFTGLTMLRAMHVHLFVFGFILFLVLALYADRYPLLEEKKFHTFLLLWNIGLPGTVGMMLIHGILQVLRTPLSTGTAAMIAGIAGIFHLLLTIGLILLYQCCQKVLPQ